MAAERTILLAAPRSFCAGVQRAIKAVEQALEQRGGPVYVRKQIVHNSHVVSRLAAKGAVFVDELDQIPGDATVVLSAHGVSPAVRKEASRRGLEVIDTTCPLVAKGPSIFPRRQLRLSNWSLAPNAVRSKPTRQ